MASAMLKDLPLGFTPTPSRESYKCPTDPTQGTGKRVDKKGAKTLDKKKRSAKELLGANEQLGATVQKQKRVIDSLREFKESVVTKGGEMLGEMTEESADALLFECLYSYIGVTLTQVEPEVYALLCVMQRKRCRVN